MKSFMVVWRPVLVRCRVIAHGRAQALGAALGYCGCGRGHLGDVFSVLGALVRSFSDGLLGSGVVDGRRPWEAFANCKEPRILGIPNSISQIVGHMFLFLLSLPSTTPQQIQTRRHLTNGNPQLAMQ